MLSTIKFKSLFVQAIYVFSTGLSLIFIPNMILELVGFTPTNEIWIRILGIIVLTLSIFYTGVIRHGNADIIKYTIYGRIFAGLSIISLVISGLAQPMVALFACVDIATALWSWAELKNKI